MKNKITALILLAISVAVQLLIPFSYITKNEITAKRGGEYRLEISSFFQYDEGLYLSYSCETPEQTKYYTVFEEQENGVYIENGYTYSRPDSGVYLKTDTSDKYMTSACIYEADADTADKLMHEIWILSNNGRYFYAAVKLLNGHAVLTGVFLDDGTPIEALIS